MGGRISIFLIYINIRVCVCVCVCTKLEKLGGNSLTQGQKPVSSERLQERELRNRIVPKVDMGGMCLFAHAYVYL
jgi:hypothetical protein